MNIQFKKGVLELCVLVVLCRKNFYGYELVQTISKNIDISDGTPKGREYKKVLLSEWNRFTEGVNNLIGEGDAA
jgi:PadR family transcriptional regulator PadR